MRLEEEREDMRLEITGNDGNAASAVRADTYEYKRVRRVSC